MKIIGEIKVMAQTVRTDVQILSTDRIAQLVLIPYIKAGKILSSREWGKSGFDSSDVYRVQQIKQERPTMTLDRGKNVLWSISYR